MRKCIIQQQRFRLRRKLAILVLLLVGMFFTSCATSVTFQTYEPAKIDLSGYTTIGVLPFVSDYSFGSGLEVSISPFFRHVSFGVSYTNPSKVASYATNTFYDKLVAEKAFMVIPAGQLEHFYSGWLMSSQLEYFADVLQIDALVLGSIKDVDIDDELVFRYEYSYDAGRTVKKAYYMQSVDVVIEYLLVDTRTHQIIAREQLYGDASFSEYVPPRIGVGGSEWSWYAYYSAPAISKVYKRAVREALAGVGASLVPQQVTVQRYLMKADKDPFIELGNNLAEDRYYAEALHNYLQAWHLVRHPAGAYNGAIMYEVMGDYPSAIALAEELTGYYYDKKAFTLLHDLRVAAARQERAKAQLEGYVLLD